MLAVYRKNITFTNGRGDRRYGRIADGQTDTGRTLVNTIDPQFLPCSVGSHEGNKGSEGRELEMHIQIRCRMIEAYSTNTCLYIYANGYPES